MTLVEEQLRAFLPALPPGTMWTGSLNTACARFEITTLPRLAAFLAQVTYESGEFRRLVENLNYSAQRLTEVWPHRFTTLAFAQQYEHQPEKIANYVYANRNGNGDVPSGDGWVYRGRGLIQLTGRANYRLSGQALIRSYEAQPDLLASPDDAALSAAQFWGSRGLSRLADLETVEAFDDISQRINGGTGGLLERRTLWERAKVALA